MASKEIGIIKLTQENYIVQAKSEFLKWSIKTEPDYVEFEGGPTLKVGYDFFGLGTILKLKEDKEIIAPGYKSVLVEIFPSSYKL